MRLERLLHGIVLTEEITPRTRDLALSFGERLSAPLLAGALSSSGFNSRAVEADKAGLLTDGEFGNASVDPHANRSGFRRHVGALADAGIIPVVTGFFGANAQGRTTTFGRGGSDYSAAVIAAIFEAESLDIWKDVDGFMTADPKVIPFARTIERLSYQEAAELAYFGAKVIHPRTVEPLRTNSIPIRVLNSFKRDEPGTVIAGQAREVPDAIKSVAYTTDIAVLKIHGVGVGFKPGVLNDLAGALAAKGINIKSVITSQTCISLLLEGRDLRGAHEALKALGSHIVENLEDVTDIALVGVVGEGIVRTKGLAARAFTSVAKENVNVLMISAGASSAAYYFVVRKEDLDKVVKAVHAEFFG
jgi:aspartate kinase